MFTKYFDEYEVGEKWSSQGRTITETDIVNFAGISGDFYSLHTDKEYAATTPFGERIAHGMLILSIGTGLMEFSKGKLAAFYGIERLRFVKPTFIGDTIHVEMIVDDLEDKGNGTGVLTIKEQIKKQNGDQVAVAIVKILMNKRGE
ncbi:MaoC family dehydratase N-terminal domain-containing protein [Cytobacillus spongiae]|jgi:acyl dehydratase|uniref:MaoC/PaaZ C-terminal domain-containing protein n=1 Tax=Cytobacillus spongiae TaxID=2901381 RepID=UPI001F3A9BEC|nr:MaoC/PaaZ C-terminal domain-containing protein [Cytobacillus spongiae]UII54190.1 MaoC family dehydratase N-terminal domain-containing protein [Cytobacillus spongiae]